MTNPLMTRRRIATVAIESTKGTAIETGTVDMFCYDPKMEPDAEFVERKASGKYMGHTAAGIVTGRAGSFSCRVELRGDGTSALDPALAVIMQCCGFKLDTGTYAFTSAQSEQKTCTITLYEDGVKKQLRGCSGNVTLEGEAGGAISVNVEMRGGWIAPVDAALPSATFNATIPPKLDTATFTIGGSSIPIGRFSLATNNETVDRSDITQPGGLGYVGLGDRDPTISLDPEAQLVATYDFHGLWSAGTTAVLSLVIGSGAGGQITISAPALQYREVKPGSRGPIATYDITGQLVQTDGDDELSIAVAAA